MEHDFTMMSFARLKDADVGYVQRATGDREERVQLLRMLNEYLRFLGEGDNPEDEKLFVLGQELKTIWPHEFRQELVNSVRKHAHASIAEIFLAGLGAMEGPAKESAKPRLPSKQEFDSLISRLKTDSFSSLESTVRGFWKRHVAYAEHSGDAHLLPYVLGRISDAILKMESPDQSEGAGLVREIVLSALRWEPWNKYLWNVWARAYLAEHAVGAAEDVLWEAIRRMPPNEHARTRLIGLLERFKDRQWEALESVRKH
jgi:hypothetical protein